MVTNRKVYKQIFFMIIMVQKNIQEVVQHNYIDSCTKAGVPLNSEQIGLLEGTLDNVALIQPLDKGLLEKICNEKDYQRLGRLISSIIYDVQSEPINLQALALYKKISEITEEGKSFKRGAYFSGIPRNFSGRQFKVLQQYLKEKGFI